MLHELKRGLACTGYVPGAAIVVALSGGPDSTALTLSLHDLLAEDALAMTAAHFNHRLRGDESDADEQFARNLCQRLGIRLAVGHAPTTTDDAPTPTHVSENAAREMRYRFLERTASALGARYVATAHTADDQAETVLLRIMRGTGIRGIAGMRRSRPLSHRSDIALIRPMLHIDAATARAVLAKRGVTARNDASNLDRRYTRNRLRHDILPTLRATNPGITYALHALAADALAHQQLVEALAAPHLPKAAADGIASEQLASLPQPVAAYILQQMHSMVANDPQAQLGRVHIAETLRLANRPEPSDLHLPGGVVVRSRYGTTTMFPLAHLHGEIASERLTPLEHLLPIPGELQLADNSILRSTIEVVPIDLARGIDRDGRQQVARLSKAIAGAGHLRIRNRSDGDRFQPLGMAHSVKLQDFFVNQKVPREQRDAVLLAESPTDGRIACVIGWPPAEWAKVRPGDGTCVQLTWFPAR